MTKLRWAQPESVAEVCELVQAAIDLEFATLPPYLYAKFSILPETNAGALSRLNMIVGQEMIHMCLACNILNAIGAIESSTRLRVRLPTGPVAQARNGANARRGLGVGAIVLSFS